VEKKKSKGRLVDRGVQSKYHWSFEDPSNGIHQGKDGAPKKMKRRKKEFGRELRETRKETG